MSNATNIPYDRNAEGRLLNVAQVMERLNCSRRYVYTLISVQELKAIRIGERQGIRVTEKSLGRFLSRRAARS